MRLSCVGKRKKETTHCLFKRAHKCRRKKGEQAITNCLGPANGHPHTVAFRRTGQLGA